jgi:hypothetical protein
LGGLGPLAGLLSDRKAAVRLQASGPGSARECIEGTGEQLDAHVRDFTQLLPNYMHVRFAGTMLISPSSLPKDDGTGSGGDADTGPATDSGGVSEDGKIDYLGELDMRWQESAIVYREGECKLPLTLDLDADGNITGGVTCAMAEAGDTSLDFTGVLSGKTITGTIEFVVSDFSWTDAWSCQ